MNSAGKGDMGRDRMDARIVGRRGAKDGVYIELSKGGDDDSILHARGGGG